MGKLCGQGMRLKEGAKKPEIPNRRRMPTTTPHTTTSRIQKPEKIPENMCYIFVFIFGVWPMCGNRTRKTYKSCPTRK